MNLTRPQALWGAMLSVWALLLWHGGLEAGQAPLAALGLVLALSAWQPGRVSLTDKALAALLALALLGLPGSLRPQYSLDLLGLGLLLLLLLHALRRTACPWPKLWPRMVLAVGTVAALAFLALSWGPDGLRPPHLAARPLFPNQNLLCAGLVLPAFLLAAARLSSARAWSWALASAAALCLVALAYSASKMVALALLLSLAWLWWRQYSQSLSRRSWALGLALALFGLMQWLAPFQTAVSRVQHPGDPHALHRRLFWEQSLKQSLQRPCLGSGLGSFPAAAQRMDLPAAAEPGQAMRYRMTLDHAHDEALNLAVELGWPAALLACAAALLWVAKRLKRREAEPAALGLEAGMIGILTCALTDMPFRTPVLLLGLLISYAWLEPLPSKSPAVPASKPWLYGRVLLASCLLCTSLGWYWGSLVARSARAGKQPGILADAAAVLRPLDGALAGYRLPRAWPWSTWSGRQEPLWWSRSAALQPEPSAALNAWAQASRKRPYHAPYMHAAAASAMRAGQPELSLQWAERAAVLEPDDAVAQALRLEACLSLKDEHGVSASLQELRRIEALLPSFDQSEPMNRLMLDIDWQRVHTVAQTVAHGLKAARK